MKSFKADDIVMSCSRIESGLRLAHDGVRACTFSTGAVEAPNYWDVDNIPIDINKNMIVEKRKELFNRLNDSTDTDLLCRKCTHWVKKKYEEVRFDQIEFLNVAHFSACNLRCNYCGFTKTNDFQKEKYSALKILRQFSKEDVTFESSVDFNAGEPTLMKDLSEHLEYFRSNGMRVRLYSNGVIYSQAVFDAVQDGTITWLIISVDAGTPTTYTKTKKADNFNDVIANIAKYREAEINGKGKVAAKYIFTEDTLGDDDIFGFLYAMMAIGITNIWMLYDYTLSHFDSLEDKKNYIESYARMYTEFLKWGITPLHFGDSAAGDVIPIMKEFMDLTKQTIEILIKNKIDLKAVDKSQIIIFKKRSIKFVPEKIFKKIDLITLDDDFKNNKIIVAPSGVATLNLLDDDYFKRLNIVAFCDLSISKIGKKLNNINIYSYKDINSIDFNKILITSEYFFNDILNDMNQAVDLSNKEIFLLSDDSVNRRY